jgi:hypothetical protein
MTRPLLKTGIIVVLFPQRADAVHAWVCCDIMSSDNSKEKQMSIADIQGMTKLERIHAMEMLWESLNAETDEMPSPEWHKDVLQARRQMQDSGEATFMTLQQLKQMSRK